VYRERRDERKPGPRRRDQHGRRLSPSSITEGNIEDTGHLATWCPVSPIGTKAQGKGSSGSEKAMEVEVTIAESPKKLGEAGDRAGIRRHQQESNAFPA